MRRANVERGRLDYLVSRMQLARGEWAAAARTLERALPLLDAYPALLDQVDLLLGACYEQLDAPGMRVNAYARIAARNPDSVTARTRLASAQAAAGRLDNALEQYRQVAARPDAPAGTPAAIRL